MVIQEHRITGAHVGEIADLLCSKNKGLSRRWGQSTVEFAFGMIVFGLLIYGLVQCFRWVILDLAERRVDHDRILINKELSTEAQLNPNFHRIRKIDAVLPAEK